MKKHFEDGIGIALGAATPLADKIINDKTWNDWGQPLLLSALCAVVGFLVTQLCKWAASKLKRNALPKFRQNGKQ